MDYKIIFQNCIVLYINSQLKPELLLIDEHGRILGIDVELYRAKTMLLGIYAPNEDKAQS